jgi:hypothetical protein
MIAKAERRPTRPVGFRARLRAFFFRRQAREDAEDLELIREALAEGGEPISWEQVKRDLGLSAN